jgi:hypothetical protein
MPSESSRLVPVARREERLAVEAAAPRGISEAYLGRPFDAQFRPLVGADAAPLFANAETGVPDVRVVPINEFDHSLVAIGNSTDLSANLGAWGIVSAEAGTASDRRFASYRAYQIDDMREVDDARAIGAVPPGAVWYLARVYYGRRYEVVFSGSARTFHAGVQARLKVVSGGMHAFASQNHLEVRVIGTGLAPTSDDAIFARTPEEIEASYSAAEDPTAIYVEYRRVPGRDAGMVEDIAWVQPLRTVVRFDELRVYKDGSIGADTWSLNITCKVNGTEVFSETPDGWDAKTHVEDNRLQADPGPGGDANYTPYDLGWSHELEVTDGDELRCGVSGMALDASNPVEYAEFQIDLRRGARSRDRIGAAGKHTEYWAYYSVEVD